MCSSRHNFARATAGMHKHSLNELSQVFAGGIICPLPDREGGGSAAAGDQLEVLGLLLILQKDDGEELSVCSALVRGSWVFGKVNLLMRERRPL